MNDIGFEIGYYTDDPSTKKQIFGWIYISFDFVSSTICMGVTVYLINKLVDINKKTPKSTANNFNSRQSNTILDMNDDNFNWE